MVTKEELGRDTPGLCPGKHPSPLRIAAEVLAN